MGSAVQTTVLFGIFLILRSAESATDNPQCERSNACQCYLPGGKVINLMPLASSYNNASFSQGYNDSTLVTYNPCKSFNGEDECQDAAACFTEKAEYTGVYFTTVFGKQDTSNWTVAEKERIISYKYKDRTFVVSLVCTDEPGANFTILDISEKRIKVELTSKCACPDGCPMGVDPQPAKSKHSISTGTILLILFFSLVFCYLVGGILYNKIINGATGKELIPNVEFWSALPRLCLDGVAFTCNCCGKRKSTPGYDNV